MKHVQLHELQNDSHCIDSASLQMDVETQFDNIYTTLLNMTNPFSLILMTRYEMQPYYAHCCI